MTYVTGYLLAVSTANKDAYLALSRRAGPIFKKYGATRVVENWGVDTPDGKVTSFPMAVKAKEGETIVFSWMEWPSKEVADVGTKRAMEDPAFTDDDAANMPFDGMRMMWGGFEMIYEE